MPRFFWARWVKSLFNRRVKTYERKPRYRLSLEQLETRLAPATHNWTGGSAVDSNWSTAANWSGGAPTNGDDLIFAAGAARLTNNNDINNAAFHSITFSGSNYVLQGKDVTLTTGNIIANQGSVGNTIQFNINMGGTAGNKQFITVGTQGASLTVSGQIKGSTGVELSKSGPGTLVLTADNSQFTGQITVVNGIISILNSKALGSTSAQTVVQDNGTTIGQIQIDGSLGDITNIAEPLRISGAGPSNDGALLSVSGNNTWTGPITLDKNSTIGANAGSLTIYGVIGDLGAGYSLTKEGTAQVILDPLGTNTGNTYHGQTIVNAGLLTIHNSLALGNDATATNANSTVVNSFPNRSGTLQVEYPASAPPAGLPARLDPNVNGTNDGFTVPNEKLVLNGPGIEGIHFLPKQSVASGGATVTGALNNAAGNNTWAQDISLWGGNPNGAVGSGDSNVLGDGSFWNFGGASAVVGIGVEANTTLTFTGHIVDTNLSGTATDVNNRYGLIKTRPGRLIIVHDNAYRGRTEILEGYLNIRDSRALGATTNQPFNGTFIFPDATLELEADSIDDSASATTLYTNPQNALPHLATDIIMSNELLRPMGNGVNGDGAIRSIRGVNELTGDLQLQRSIPRTGVSFSDVGASIGVLPDYAPYTSLFDRSQLTLSGVLGNDPAVGASQLTKFGQGELVLTNSNTYTGATYLREGWITARNDRALGQDFGNQPDTLQPETYVAQGAALVLKETRQLLATDPVPVGITMYERLFLSGDGIDHPLEPALYGTTAYGELSHKGALVNLSGQNTVTGIVNLVATTAFNQVAIGVDIDSTDVNVTASDLTFTNLMQEALSNQANVLNGIANPPALIPAGIDKLGRKRLILQNPATFTGDNDIEEGIVRIQSDTALGLIAGTTTVESGAALELQGYVAGLNGGLPGGIQVRESFILNGAGNDTADDATHDYSAAVHVNTLTNRSDDNSIRTPVTLQSSGIVLDVKADSRLSVWGNIGGTAGFTKLGTGKMILGGNNTYEGDTLINEGTVNIESATALGAPSNGATGGTTVAADAQLELQGDITIGGEDLVIKGNGPDATPNIPFRWFSEGPAAITDTTVSGNASTGRVTGVVVDPFDANVIYLSAADGGAWRSKNGGLTWEPLFDRALVDSLLGTPSYSDQTQILFTGAIAVSPTNSNYIYVGLGEANNSADSYYGRGILMSSDYGKNWTLIQPPTPAPGAFDRQTISKIVVDPTHPEIIYVAVQGNGYNGVTPTSTSYGMWLYNPNLAAGSQWINLTASSPAPIGGTSSSIQSQRYSDVVVLNANPALGGNFPNNPNRRIIYIALGDYTGGGSPTNHANSPFYAEIADITVAAPSASWSGLSFQTIFEGINTPGTDAFSPRWGTIKLAANRVGNTVTAYAAANYPLNSSQESRGTSGQFRQMWVDTVSYNSNTNQWVPASWGGFAAPPSNPSGSQGWYDTALAVSPTNAGVVFLGGVGGTAGAGPYLYNNGAWKDVDPGADGKGPHINYHASFFDRNGDLLVGTDGGIWRLENAATATDAAGAAPAQWTNLNGNFLQLTQFTGLDVHPFDPFFAVGGSGGTVVSGGNGLNIFTGGNTWAQATGSNGNVGTVQINNKNTNIVFYTKDGVLYRSTNGAAGPYSVMFTVNNTFSPILPGNGLYFPVVLDDVTPSRVFLGQNSTLRESTNDGASNSFIVIGSAVNGFGIINKIGLGNRQGPVSGSFVVDPSFPLQTDQGANSYASGTIYVLTSNGVFVTKNEGQNWVQRNGTGTNILSRAVQTLTVPGTNFGGSYTLGYNGSTATFDTQSTALEIQIALNALPTIGGAGGSVTVDRVGNIFTITFGGTLAANPLQLTVSNGGNPTPQASIASFNSYVDFVVDPRDANTAYVVRNAFGLGKVYKTTDAGQNWTDITSNLPDLPTWKVVVNSRTGDVYVGNDNGVYVLDQAGGTWSRLGTGMPNVQVKTLVYNETTNILTAGTYGRGMFQLWLDDSKADSGALRVVSGSSIWTGDIKLTGPTDIRSEKTAELTILGSISDSTVTTANTINKVGPGRLVFAAANTYAGLTDIEEGVLATRDSNALGSAALPVGKTIVEMGAALEIQNDLFGETVEVHGNGINTNGHFNGAVHNVSGDNTFTGRLVLKTSSTIGVDSGSSLTIGPVGANVPGMIDDEGNTYDLTKELTGTLILNAANTVGGIITVNQGILRVGHGSALGGTANGTVVRNGAQIQLSNNITVAGEVLKLSGFGQSSADPFGTGALQNFSGNNTWQGPVIFQAIPSVPAPPPAAPPSSVSIGALNAGETLTIDGPITEDLTTPTGVTPTPTYTSFGLIKVGPGKVILKQSNSYTGDTLVTNGILNVQAAGALGSNPAGTAVGKTIVSAGAALELEGNVTFDAEPLFLTRDGISPANVGALRNISGNNTWTGDVTIQAAGAGQITTIGVNPTTQLIISGVVQDPTPVPAIISALRKLGTGTLVLTNANTFRGRFFINQGVVAIANATALGDTLGVTTVSAGATLRLQNNITVSNGEVLQLAGNGFGSAGALENASGSSNTWQSPIVLTANAAIGVTGASDTLTLNRTISDSNPGFGVTKVGPGTLDYAGGAGTGNTYRGATQVNEGTLLLSKTGGAVPVIGNLVIGDTLPGNATVRWMAANQIPDTGTTVTVKSDGTLDLNGLTDTIGTVTILDGQATTGATGSGLLTVGILGMTGGTFNAATLGGKLILAGSVTATSSATSAAVITGLGSLDLNGAARNFTINKGAKTSDLKVSASIIGNSSANLNKLGAGRLEIDAATAPTGHTYTGVTNANAGDIQVDGDTSSSPVSLGGGTLSGMGTVGKITSALAGGTVDPGDNGPPAATGVLTSSPGLGNTDTWNTATTFFVNLNSPDPGTGPAGHHDQLVVNGSIDLGGAKLDGVVASPPGVNINDSFTIIRTTGLGTVSGTFTDPFFNVPHHTNGQLFVGGQKFTVVYNSNSVVLTRVKNNAYFDTVTGVVSSANPSVYGQDITFTATITPEPGASAIPTTDTVTFNLDDNGTPPPIGTSTKNVDASGKATYNPKTDSNLLLVPNTYSLVVTFNGDANFNTVTSSPFSQVVNKSDTTVGVTNVSPASPVFGEDVTFTATVSAKSPGGSLAGSAVPTNTVTFTVDGDTAHSQPVTLGSNAPAGQAKATFSGLSRGLHQVHVDYSGDSNYNTSATNPDFQQTVDFADTSVTVTTSPPTGFGSPVTLKAKVDAVPPGAGTPMGTVNFYDGTSSTGTLLGPGTYDSGTKEWTLVYSGTLTVGTHTITAAYLGDTSFNGDEGTGSQIILAGTTTTLATGSPNPSNFGQSVAFTATVTGNVSGAGNPTTGSVSYYDGASATPFGTANLSGSNVATLNYSGLSLGSHMIHAVYNGDGSSFGVSPDSNTVSQTVNATPSATSFTATPATNTYTYGTPIPDAPNPPKGVTFKVKFTSPAGTPTGTVTFSSSQNGTLGTGTYSSGTQDWTLTTTPTKLYGGAHTITASYVSNNGFQNSTGTLSYTVIKAGTTTTLSTSNTSPGQGQTVTLTANVVAKSPSTAKVNGGTVTFYDGPVGSGTVLGTIAVNANGVATLNTSFATMGAHTINAKYNGTVNFVTSDTATSGSVTLNVLKATSTSLTPGSPNPSNFGQSVAFTATVTGTPASAGNPTTGSVSFFDGASATTPFATANLIGTGPNPNVATVNYSGLSAGSHAIRAVYNGDSTNYAASPNSNTVNQTVKSTTSTSLTSSASPSNTSQFNQPVTFTATVTGTPASAGNPTTGSVSFFDGASATTPFATVNLSGSNVATLSNYTALSVGSHAIRAVYNGSTNFAASPNSNTINHTVNPANTSTSLATGSPNPSDVSQQVTFVATVTRTAAGTGNPTSGTVTFFDGATPIGSPVNVDANGKATLNTSFATTGNHSITAKYNGSTNFAASPTSTAVSQQVNVKTATTVTGSPNPSAKGQAVTFTATVTRASGQPAGANPTTGSVSFYDGATLLGTANLGTGGGLANQAVFNYAAGFSTGGAHSITAVYSGVANSFNGSTSAVFTQNVVGTLTYRIIDQATGQTVTSVSVGSAFTIEVTARDANGNVVTSYNAPVTLTLMSGPAGGQLNGNKSKNFSSGVATFDNLTVDTATTTQPYVVRAQATGTSLFVDIQIFTRARE